MTFLRLLRKEPPLTELLFSKRRSGRRRPFLAESSSSEPTISASKSSPTFLRLPRKDPPLADLLLGNRLGGGVRSCGDSTIFPPSILESSKLSITSGFFCCVEHVNEILFVLSPALFAELLMLASAPGCIPPLYRMLFLY